MFRLRSASILIAVVWSLFCWPPSTKARQNALAIFNLRPTNIEAMGYNGDILYALISTLEQEKTIELMPRREMEEILFHANMVQGDNPELVSKAGKVLGINFILFGQVTKTGQKIHAHLKLMDIENGGIVKTWEPSFSGREAILNEVPALARELSSSIQNIKQPAVPTPNVLPRPRIDIQNFMAENQGEKVVLSWKSDPSHPIDAFNIYRSESLAGPYQFHAKTSGNNYNDSKIKKGHSYIYCLGIMLSSGEEIRSRQSVQIKNVGEKIPHPPLILEGKGQVRRTTIKFVPSLQNDQEKFKITAYKVYRREKTDGDWKHIVTMPAELTSQSELAFNVEDTKTMADGRSYTYAASSMDDKNRESPLSDPLSLTTIQLPVLKVEKENLLRKIILGWQPLENVQGCYLYRRAAEEAWERVGKVTGITTTTIEDNMNLEDGKTYQYYLTAYDTKGETGPSNRVEAKTKDLPNPPEDLLAENGLVKSVRLYWTPVNDPDVGGYLIFRGTSQEKLKMIDKIKGATSNSYLDDGPPFFPLKDGTEYFYVVASFNLFGAEGRLTPAVKARTKPVPTRVRGFMAAARQNQIVLKWEQNPEPDIKTYILYRNRNDGSWSNIKELDADQSVYQDIDLKPEVKYRYKIIAEDKDGLKSEPMESDTILSPLAKPGGK